MQLMNHELNISTQQRLGIQYPYNQHCNKRYIHKYTACEREQKLSEHATGDILAHSHSLQHLLMQKHLLVHQIDRCLENYRSQLGIPRM